MVRKLKDYSNDREQYVCQTPILLIAFNRPDTTKKVFEQIRNAQPRKFYFAVDAARIAKGDAEIKLNEQVKEIAKLVDWSCELHTLFRTENRGCGYGPAEAITWAFENEDRLIVLEDDCVPSLSFFSFCDEMLERYKDDYRVNIISGRSHHQGTKFFVDQDYIFTHYAHTWGWATWKRAWLQFDMRMSDYPAFVKNGGTDNVFFDKKEAEFWEKQFENVYKNIEKEVSHSWDMQWVYARLKEGGLGIVPAHNLISNIGAGNGTHTSTAFIDIPTSEMPGEIRHPNYVIINRDYEQFHFKSLYKSKGLLLRIYNRIKRSYLFHAD